MYNSGYENHCYNSALNHVVQAERCINNAHKTARGETKVMLTKVLSELEKAKIIISDVADDARVLELIRLPIRTHTRTR